jgi:hypothetical protein
MTAEPSGRGPSMPERTTQLVLDVDVAGFHAISQR